MIIALSQVPAISATAKSKIESKNLHLRGPCKWCNRCTALYDFTSVFDGQEVYCTELCSEKCFIEAAKHSNREDIPTTKERYLFMFLYYFVFLRKF